MAFLLSIGCATKDRHWEFAVSSAPNGCPRKRKLGGQNCQSENSRYQTERGDIMRAFEMSGNKELLLNHPKNKKRVLPFEVVKKGSDICGLVRVIKNLRVSASKKTCYRAYLNNFGTVEIRYGRKEDFDSNRNAGLIVANVYDVKLTPKNAASVLENRVRCFWMKMKQAAQANLDRCG
jgi:hypothetical protein